MAVAEGYSAFREFFRKNTREELIKGLPCGILTGFTGTELLSLVNHHLRDSSLSPVHSPESCSVAHRDKKA